MTRTMTRVWWAAVLMLGLHPARASAHARLRKSEPAANARLSAAPHAIRLWFTESPEVALTTITLVDSSGHALPLGAPARDAEGSNGISVTITNALANGSYTVKWHTAASDGHPSSGSFTFRVSAAAEPAVAVATAAPPSPSASPAAGTAIRPQPAAQQPVSPAVDGDSAALAPAYVATRALSFIALLLAIGAITFHFGVVSRVLSLDAPTRATMSAAAAARAASVTVVLLLAALVRLWLQNRMLAGNAAADAAHLRTMAMETSWGSAWRLQLGAALAMLTGFALAWRRVTAGWLLAGLACIIVAFATSLAGHAGAADTARGLALLADLVHILAASAWMGSLAWLLFVGLGMRGTAIPLVRAFSPLALLSAALVMLSGIASAWMRLGTLPNLWASSYGQVLLLKLLVLAGVAASGFYNWKRATPALGAEGSTERLQRSASTELAFALGVVIVTAVLVAMPLPAT